MRRRRAGMVATTCLLALCASACGERSPERTAGRTVQRSVDPRGFDRSTEIDNRWYPLRPGTRFVYVGTVSEEGRQFPHRVVFTVTDLVKVIDGVRTVVVWDRDYTAGRLVEGELAFFAQDNGGTVWSLGEYPEEYEEGKLTGAPDTWIAGLAGARAGILMPADPRPGTPSYLQGWAPEIDFADQARVYLVGQDNCIPLDCYADVLVIDEWNPSEPGAHQRKYYAPGVGNIRIGPAGGEEREGLVLTEVSLLGAKALAKIRREALKLDGRAYEVRKDLYGLTPPAERLLPTR